MMICVNGGQLPASKSVLNEETTMSQQPPPPPDMPTPLPYDDAPARKTQNSVPNVVGGAGRVVRGGFRGLVWAFSGFLGRIVLILVLAIILVGVVGNYAGGIWGGVSQSLGDGLRDIANLFGPLPVDTSGVVIPDIEPIRDLSDLTTKRYSYASVVVGDTGMPGLLQQLYGENLVMVAVGHIESGVDLSQLTDDALVYDEETQTLTLTLPPATLQSCFLNEQDSYVVSRTTGIFARNLPELDNIARRTALEQFRDQSLEDGVLSDAQERAETVTASLMRLFSSEDVTIQVVSAPQSAEVAMDETCR
jgi:hypothetical protein